MPTDKEIYDLIELLLDAYSHYKPRNLEQLVDLWVRKFEHVAINVLREAVDLHIDSSQYFPSIADINAQLATAEYNVLNMDALGVDRAALDDKARRDWEAASDESRDDWAAMMEADGRVMVSPGVWGPVER